MNLKRHLQILLILACLTGSFAGTSALGQKKLNASPALDADGDQIPDALDRHPLVPDSPSFSWWISGVTVGSDLEQSQVGKVETLSGNETSVQRKSSFTICAGIGLGGGYSEGQGSGPALLSLLPGGSWLKSPGEGFRAQSQLGATFDYKKSRERSEMIKEIRSEFQRLEKQCVIKNRHIEFTVEFFNATDDVYQFRNFSIPVQTVSRQTRAEALCFAGEDLKRDFDVPANRPAGYPVRFRALLSTTQSEQILDALEQGELTIAIERASGTAVTQETGIDEIARRQQLAESVAKQTCSVEFNAGSHSTRWQVARNNPRTKKPTTLREAIAAINEIAAEAGDSSYIETSAGMVYAVGSFRNSPLNAFEVANARLAPLKVRGWLRTNAYGSVPHGQWLHQLDQPLGDGVTFVLDTYAMSRNDLASEIQRKDPNISSEWLALCDFWLNYDSQKAFPLYHLSRTSYPLALFFNSLTPDFAVSNFEQMVSKWMTSGKQETGQATRGETAKSIENTNFRDQVRLHRKAILDAAFAGYSEAGALLTRLSPQERDAMESSAVLSALEMGNLDAAAMESVSRLIHDLNSAKKVDLSRVEIPEHVFSMNMLGFLQFVRCNQGIEPGPVNDAARQAFSYSAALGDPFAQAMNGWLLVNNARYKRGKIMGKSNWPKDRDLGVEMLEKSAKHSAIGKYILGKIYFANTLAIEKDPEKSRRYLQLAADQSFGDASQAYQERFAAP